MARRRTPYRKEKTVAKFIIAAILVSVAIQIVIRGGTSCVFAHGYTIRIGGVFDAFTADGKPNFSGITEQDAFLLGIKHLNAIYEGKNITFEYAVRQTGGSFTTATIGSLDLAHYAFGGKGIHGAVAASSNSVCKSTAYILQDAGLSQVAFGCDAPELSNSFDFPYFMRVNPNAAYEGTALAHLMCGHYGWKRVVIVHTTDIYGIDAVAEYEYVALSYGTTIVHKIAIIPGQLTDFSYEINQALPFKPRIFVLLMSNVAQAAQFCEEGYRAGLLNINTAVWGTSVLDTPQLWRSIPTQSLADEVMITIGFMTMSRANNDWKVSSRGRAFIEAFLAQPDTVTTTASGEEQCDNATDSMGGTNYLYQTTNSSGSTICLGLNRSRDFRADGWDIPWTAAYVYDATLSMGLTAVNFSAAVSGSLPGEKGFYVPSEMDPTPFANYFLRNVSFEGVTGPIAFSPGRHEIFNYGLGDRLHGQRFAVVNFQFDNRSESGFYMRRVATWGTDEGYWLCGTDDLLQTAVTAGCYDIWWGTPGNIVPLDRDPPIKQEMPQAIRNLLLALAAIQMAVVLFIGGSLIRFRRKRLMKASQPVMMWLVLVSGVFSAARVGLGSAPPSDGVCLADYWMGHLAVTGVVALFVKTLRVHLIVNMSGLRRIKVTTSQVMGGTFAVDVIIVVYMAFMSKFNSPYKSTQILEAITGQATYIPQCATPSGSLDAVLYALEAFILLLCAKLCYDTKDVPDAINETKVIALAIFLIVIFAAIGFPLILVLGLAPYICELLLGICFFFAVTSMLVIYFGPKLYLLYTGADLNAKFQIVRKGDAARDQAAKEKEERLQAAAAEADEEEVKRRDAVVGQYIMKPPQSAEEIEHLFAYLRARLMDINVRALNGSNSLSGGSSTTRGGSKGASYAVDDPTSQKVPNQNPNPNRRESSRFIEPRRHSHLSSVPQSMRVGNGNPNPITHSQAMDVLSDEDAELDRRIRHEESISIKGVGGVQKSRSFLIKSTPQVPLVACVEADEVGNIPENKAADLV